MVDSAAREPVMISLGPPARRSLTEGLIRGIGAAEALELDRMSESAIADFLAEIVHAETGFVARTDSGGSALAIVAGTVAALCGEDIRRALRDPDLVFLRGLKPSAIEATRAVLLAVETGAPETVASALAPLNSR
ncbi:hypothetical protein D5S18_12885 [Nocardia panacis]|uniref:Uncharacterized protein n=1 Tax=Nocardia panacis TaxID=2340916 RepID=A0A3A4KPL5_9NOCA|nr:hypothetical protein [Nocardia panacis]RJO77297.1 hypothetical protein D5S18_12885 [Nocardia panacis]